MMHIDYSWFHAIKLNMCGLFLTILNQVACQQITKNVCGAKNLFLIVLMAALCLALSFNNSEIHMQVSSKKYWLNIRRFSMMISVSFKNATRRKKKRVEFHHLR